MNQSVERCLDMRKEDKRGRRWAIGLLASALVVVVASAISTARASANGRQAVAERIAAVEATARQRDDRLRRIEDKLDQLLTEVKR